MEIIQDMAKQKVLLEFASEEPAPFALNEAAVASGAEAERQARGYLDLVAGLGVELDDYATPVPMLTGPDDAAPPAGLEGLAATREGASGPGPMPARTMVVPCQAPPEAIEALRSRPACASGRTPS